MEYHISVQGKTVKTDSRSGISGGGWRRLSLGIARHFKFVEPEDQCQRHPNGPIARPQIGDECASASPAFLRQLFHDQIHPHVVGKQPGDLGSPRIVKMAGQNRDAAEQVIAPVRDVKMRDGRSCLRESLLLSWSVKTTFSVAQPVMSRLIATETTCHAAVAKSRPVSRFTWMDPTSQRFTILHLNMIECLILRISPALGR